MSNIKHVLPPMSKDHQVRQLRTAGEWEGETNNEGYSILSRMADGLKVTQSSATADELMSIPDIWAQVETVASALIDRKHQMNQRVVAEWRALLAFIALQSFHDYSLSTKVFSLKEKSLSPNRIASGKSGRSNERHFGQLVQEMAPKRVMSEGMRWDEIALLFINGNVVATIIPTTLVCVSRSLDLGNMSQIPWVRDGRLIDPCSDVDLQPEEYAALNHYLGKLIDGIEQVALSDKDLMNGVLKALGQFRDESEKRFKEESNRQRASLTISGFSPYQQRVPLPNHPAYIALASAWQVDTGTSVVFDTALPARREFKDQIKGALLIDKEIASYGGRSPAEIRIWNMLSLDRLTDNSEMLADVRTKALNEGYFCLTPEEIFTSKLCKIRGDSEIDEHPSELKQFLLPVSPSVLMLLNPTELGQRIRIKPNDDGFTVSLSLALQSSHGSVIEHVVSRKYAPEDVVERELPDSFSLWPNFKHPNWNSYFLHYVGYLPIHFAPHQIFSVGNVLNYLDSRQNQISRADACANMESWGGVTTTRLGLKETAALIEMHMMLSPPEAVFCDAALDDELQDYVPASERTTLGVMLFPKIESAPINDNKWSFGIDFGTTNTSVYYKEENGGPRPLGFSNRVLQPYQSEKESYDRALLEFIPDREVPVPFMTILRDRAAVGSSSTRFPLLSSHIYFYNRPVNALEEIVGDASRMLKFNLKWSQRPEDRQRVQLYLGQVVLEALAEAMSTGAKPQNVDWSFSYPEAFSPSHLRSFHQICSGAVRQVMRGVENSDEPVLNSRSRSESLSAALYFIGKKSAAFTENAVTFDIGGHTTDISIWQSRRLIWRNSVEIGGRHIFIEFLKTHTKFINALAESYPVLQESVDVLHEIMEDPDKLGSGIEVLVNNSEFARAFSEGFVQVDGTEEGKILRNLSELAMAGLLHYTGRVIADLARQDLFNVHDRSHIKICLGGRTSQLYKVLLGDNSTDIKDAEQLFELFTNASENAVEGASLVFTEDPKHEVAYGLLVEAAGSANLDTENRYKDVILGEELSVDGEMIRETAIVSGLNPNKEWRVASLPALKGFLFKLREYRGIEVPITAESETELVGMVNSSLVDTRERLIKENADGVDAVETSVRGESALVEPVFVTTLRSLLKLVIKGNVVLKSHH
ncbi:MAG: hypothetical protein HOC33_05020 [Alphaproteobacteria bacterium]|jgi:hypothetical protein|nr:hypothetical protein [Alphaproteobacteria bacterium]MBT4543189.1 hypothetical protein [Alphaproteobacteria bacterium]